MATGSSSSKMTPITLRYAAPQSAQAASVCWSSCSSRSVPKRASSRPSLQIVPRIEAAGDGREVLEAVGRDHAGVLDADATHTHEVQPRLDGDHVARFERLAVGAPDGRFLVHLEPDAVPEAV